MSGLGAGTAVHIKLDSACHVELHPSPLTVFPSSHDSSSSLMLFPQLFSQVDPFKVNPSAHSVHTKLFDHRVHSEGHSVQTPVST